MLPRRRVGGGILIYPCSSIRSSVRIQIHGLSGYLLLQFWSYSFNILYDVYTHNGDVHVHRILIFFKYSQNDRQFFSYQLHKGNMVCPANSSYSFIILQDVYTHNGGVHVHRVLVFIKYLIMTGSWTSFPSYQLHNGNMVCMAPPTVFDFVFNFLWSGRGIICVLQTLIFEKSLLTKQLCP